MRIGLPETARHSTKRTVPIHQQIDRPAEPFDRKNRIAIPWRLGQTESASPQSIHQMASGIRRSSHQHMHSSHPPKPLPLPGKTLLALCLALGFQAAIAQNGPALPQTLQTNIPASVEELHRQFDQHLDQRKFESARWGVKIVSLDTGVELYSCNPRKLCIPASNTKLFTGAMALDRFGPDFRIRTSWFAKEAPSADGVVKGDLTLYGRGDPTFATRSSRDGGLAKAVEPLVKTLQAAGVKRVDGDLVADETFFHGARLGSGWDWDDMPWYYGAEVSALSLNENAVDVVVKPGPAAGAPAVVTFSPPMPWMALSNWTVTAAAGHRASLRFDRLPWSNTVLVEGQIAMDDKGSTESMSVHNPAAWFGAVLKEELAGVGIQVAGAVRTVDWTTGKAHASDPASMAEVGHVDSPPLREILTLMMKPSQNQIAQLLLLQAGADESNRAAKLKSPPGNASLSSEEAGLQAITIFCKKAGIEPGQVLLEEGSGLSRRNVVTPEATVRLLRYMREHPSFGVFMESLPVAGVDGTMKSRMKNTPAAGNLRAKTGSLSMVYALSGYVQTQAHENLAFAMFLNDYRGAEGGAPARTELDRMVVTLASLPWRTQPAASQKESPQANR